VRRRWAVVFGFLLLARECSQGKERLTWSSMGAPAGSWGIERYCWYILLSSPIS